MRIKTVALVITVTAAKQYISSSFWFNSSSESFVIIKEAEHMLEEECFPQKCENYENHLLDHIYDSFPV